MNRPSLIRSSVLRLLLTLVSGAFCPARAEVRLPALISDHMVLQKADKVPIWGTASPAEEVTVTLDRFQAKTTADEMGKWKACLDLHDASAGPFTLIVQGSNTLEILDVVVGEVWVASGQSNMEFPLRSTKDSATEIAASDNPLLREFDVVDTAAPQPQENVRGTWKTASPSTSGEFSGVAYYFGKMLQREIPSPVGIIRASVDGTPSEAWTSSEALDKIPELQAEKDRLLQYAADYPALVESTKKDFLDWLKKNDLLDRPSENADLLSRGPLSGEGWVPVNLPGPLIAPGLPANGALWLRRDVEVTDDMVSRPLTVDFGVIEGFGRIYWNGKPVQQITPESRPSAKSLYRATIPPDLVQKGKSTLALRVFLPGRPLLFSSPPMAGARKLDGEWFARAEFALPDTSAEQLAAMPQAPLQPLTWRLPAYLYNGMIHPILPYAIRGVIWYQGEANEMRAYLYRKAFPSLIDDWRQRWGRGDIPFYFCQLPNYIEKSTVPSEYHWAVLRESQSQALRLPNTAQAVLIDLGEASDIHPIRKREVGERLARIALARDYGRKISFSGPVFESAKFENGTARITFANVGDGLVAEPLPETYAVQLAAGKTSPLVHNSPNSVLEGFALCGDDQRWFWADARIEGATVLVWSENVPHPVAARYAWAANPTCNLFNKAGLPASPFRTDGYPVLSQAVDK